MQKWKKGLAIGGGVLGAILVLLVVAVLIMTNTDWGRERVRALAVGQLANAVAGHVSIGEMRGNLLSGTTLIDVEITDSAGAPFLRADTLRISYSIRSLLSKQLIFSDVLLANAELVLNQSPGGEWNFVRLFPQDTTVLDTVPGFGSWIRLEDVTIRNTNALVRMEWLPPDSVSEEARDSAIQAALAEESRPNVVTVPGGYQMVMAFEEINGRLPFVRIADPDSTARVIEVETLRTIAYPFRPPAAIVEDLAGRFVVTEDSLYFEDLRVRMPGTAVAAEGVYALGSGAVAVGLRASPLDLADLRWVRPDLPDGGGEVTAQVVRNMDRLSIRSEAFDITAEDAALQGHVDLTLGETFALGDSEVTFSGVDTDLIERLVPGRPLPVQGIASGELALRGDAQALRVDGFTEFRERSGGTSRIVADGVIGTGDAIRTEGLRLRLDPLRLDLVRNVSPDLPVRGYLTGEATLTGSTTTEFRVNGDVVHVGPSAGRSRILADGVVSAADGFSTRNLRVQLEPLQVALIRDFAPDFPLRGVLQGSATLTGSTGTAFRVDGDFVHLDPEAGRSRVVVDGTVLSGESFGARNLRVRLDPAQIAVLRAFSPDLPISGTIGGTALLNGSPATRLAADLDLALDTETGQSRVVGRAVVAPSAGPRFDVALQVPQLSLATVGQFAPAAGLHGSASGSITARGTPADLFFATDLALAEGGSIAASGNVSTAGPVLGYDVQAVFDAFDLSAATSLAPPTGLTGTTVARGTGTDPATMDARIEVRLFDLELTDTLRADTTIVDATLSDGLARVERGQIRIASARADLDGAFGLTEDRSGELRYVITVDSLADFSGFIPPDSAASPARPRTQAQRIAEARADSLRIYRETEVERAATGYPPPPRLVVDSAMPLPADSVSGSLRLEGVLAGNIAAMDTRGQLRADDLIASGVAVESADLEYDVVGFGTESASIAVQGTTAAMLARGFAFDSTSLRATYAGVPESGLGEVDVALFQDDDQDYRLRSRFLLELDRRELLLDELALRFDTISWTSARPSEISWAGDVLTIDALELTSSTGGRIFADGTVPTEGDMDLRLAIDDLPLGHIMALMQDTLQATGDLDLETTVRGSTAAPTFEGAASIRRATYGGREVPDVLARFGYADMDLVAAAEVTDGGRTLLVADASLPINLALTGVDGPRVLDRPLSVEARVDSLPLEALPSFTDAVSDIRGRVRGQISVGGTFEEPLPTGYFDLDLASLSVTAPGIALQDIAGGLRIDPDVITLDSLVAYSGGGPIRGAGTITLETLTEPLFDLSVTSDGARVLNNDLGRLRANSDLSITGRIDSLNVAGEVTVVEGVLYAPEQEQQRATDLNDPAVLAVIDTASLPDEVLPPANPLLENLNLDVAVRIARNTWVRNSAANVEIYTPDGFDPLRVRMSPGAEPTIDGVINADRGEYSFAGRVFELTTGSVTFVPGPELDPLLQLAARYEVPRSGREALVIQINIFGSLTEPRISLESTAQPPLSQSDLLAYLAFGRSSSSLLNTGDSGVGGGGGVGALAQQQLAGMAIGALVDEAVSSLERGGTRSGLDVFRIRPAALPEELAFSGFFDNLLRGTEVVAGKYISPRLFLAAQGRTTTDSWPGLRGEYRADRGFSFEATWEPRFLPVQPTLAAEQEATSARTFGAFLFWRSRF